MIGPLKFRVSSFVWFRLRDQSQLQNFTKFRDLGGRCCGWGRMLASWWPSSIGLYCRLFESVILPCTLAYSRQSIRVEPRWTDFELVLFLHRLRWAQDCWRCYVSWSRRDRSPWMGRLEVCLEQLGRDDAFQGFAWFYIGIFHLQFTLFLELQNSKAYLLYFSRLFQGR